MIIETSKGTRPYPSGGNFIKTGGGVTEVFKLTPRTFHDDFSRDAGPLGNGWIAPNWAIVDGKAVCTLDLTDNLLTDGDMETAGTAAWSSGGTPTLSKVADDAGEHLPLFPGGVQCLNIARNGNNYPTVYQWKNRTIGEWFYCSSALKKIDGVQLQLAFYDNITPVSNGPFHTTATWGVYNVSGPLFGSVYAKTIVILNLGATDGNQQETDNKSMQAITLTSMMAFRHSFVGNRVVSVGLTTPVQGINAGLIAFCDDPTTPHNFIIARHNKTYAYLDKAVWDGTKIVWTPLITATAITYTAEGILEIERIGTSFNLYYNGIQVGTTQTISDAAILAGEYDGLFSAGQPGDVQFTEFGYRRSL